ncbi:hypothetical protein LPJ57_003128 [Coemansia sp. RSA 486]|nr:hypothetical protein LPJ57_003128 [Coemansia sp. RSA 486]KAJ2238117.1 hypothetical protein IWW45_000304 [Coemansia sp. RSA 485]
MYSSFGSKRLASDDDIDDCAVSKRQHAESADCGHDGSGRNNDDKDDDDDDDDQFEDVPEMAQTSGGYGSDDSMPELGTVELTIGDDAASQPPRKGKAASRSRATVSACARAVRRHHHMAELLCHVLSIRILNQICMQQETQALALSLVPRELVDIMWMHMVPGKQQLRREWAASDLQDLLDVFRGFAPRNRRSRALASHNSHNSHQLEIEQDYARFLETRVSHKPWHRPMLLASMLRAMTFEARLCVGVTPPSLRMTVGEAAEIDARLRNVDILIANAGSDSLRRRRPKQPPLPRPPSYWVEVFDTVDSQWVSLESPSRPTHTYIIAVDDQGRTLDVTRKYASDFAHTTLPQRLESVSSKTERGTCTWWTRLLSRWGGDKDDQRESGDLQQQTLATAMPRRIADFARNPHYVLERNLRQNQVIRPRDPIVGRVRGEAVFLRENVRTLHSQMTWQRRGRTVMQGQTPAKTVGETQLFGEWQTAQTVVPPVIDGKVPRNEYGRVDLFVRSMLPPGSAHVASTHAKRICGVLGIDAVDAVVGFSFRRGVATPTLLGVVIPEECLELLNDALQNDEMAQQENARKANEARCVHNWRRLLKALQVRAQVDEAFDRRKPEGIIFKQSEEPEDGLNNDHDTQGGFLI